MTTMELHARQTRRQAERLLQRAERPIVIHGSTVLVAAAAVFIAGLAGGFALSIWEISSI